MLSANMIIRPCFFLVLHCPEYVPYKSLLVPIPHTHDTFELHDFVQISA